MKEPIQILIADDHPVVREGLSIILNAQDDMEVVGLAEDGEECVQKVRELQPDVVVMDLNMPKTSGLAAIREIAASQPGVRTLVLAAEADGEQVSYAIKAGALGFFLKDASTYQLVDAIRSVCQGTNVLSPAVAQMMLLDGKQSDGDCPPTEPLTARELDVLRLVAQGCQNKEIARALCITEQTAMGHVRNILRKLRFANRTQAALYAREHNLN